MTEKRKLAKIELDSTALTKELQDKLRQIISSSGNSTVRIPQKKLKKTDPTFVYFSDDNLEHYEGQVLGVTIYDCGDISFDVGDTCPPMTLYKSECGYLFRSHEWLMGICKNLIEVLELDETAPNEL